MGFLITTFNGVHRRRGFLAVKSTEVDVNGSSVVKEFIQRRRCDYPSTLAKFIQSCEYVYVIGNSVHTPSTVLILKYIDEIHTELIGRRRRQKNLYGVGGLVSEYIGKFHTELTVRL